MVVEKWRIQFTFESLNLGIDLKVFCNVFKFSFSSSFCRRKKSAVTLLHGIRGFVPHFEIIHSYHSFLVGAFLKKRDRLLQSLVFF